MFPQRGKTEGKALAPSFTPQRGYGKAKPKGERSPRREDKLFIVFVVFFAL